MHSDQEAQREVKQLSRLCKGFSEEVEVEESCEEGEYRQTRNYLDSLDNLLKVAKSVMGRGSRYVLIIHFYVESGQKMIQFKIESNIFIQ